jgi:two-component system, OmpR family, sensor histidine kinase BaeS
MHGHPGRFDPRSPGGPPRWWPEGEAWPPTHGWPSAGRHFIRRLVLMVAGVVLLIVTASVLWNVLAPSPEWHSVGARYLLPFAWVVIVTTWILRFVFGTARPVGDLMIAADRLAAGDYSTRVTARGWGEVRGLIHAFNEMAQQLETNEEQRRALLAEIAHELRTPLTVIHGDVEGMLDGVYPRDEAHLQPALDATLRMTRLLEDLQMLSTAEAGALRLHREPTDLARLVNEVVAAFAPQAATRGISLSADIEGLPVLDVDPVRLRQVFDNLVANALRFTSSGGSVVVGGIVWGDEVVFSVDDTGAGIPADQLPHVFERFSKSGDAKGSGLGLAVARKLVESHGGTIEAESELGRGTTITFRIPLAASMAVH